MSKKYNAALGAYQIIKNFEGKLVIGIGTGSTTDYFTKEFLPKLKDKITSIYSSSHRTSQLLVELGFHVTKYQKNAYIDVYIDGADEVDLNLNLIKGGGGAHTNEKRLAKQAKTFICIVDEEKLVETLGNFPLPIEIEPKYYNDCLTSLQRFSQNIKKREQLSDNKNYLCDLYEFSISAPLKTEEEILSIDGIIDVGIFAFDKPTSVVVGLESGYRLIDS